MRFAYFSTAALAITLLAGCASTTLPATERYTVIVPQPDSVRVFERPSRRGTVVTLAAPGDTLQVTGSALLGSFLSVQFSRGAGWVYAEHLGRAGAGGTGGVAQEYDRFNNATVFSAGPFYVRRLSFGDPNDHTMQMSASYSCPGREQCTPDTIGVALLSNSKDWVFLQSHDVVMLVDGQRLAYEAVQTGDVYLGGVNEVVAWNMPVGDFTRLTSAETAELRVGSVEFGLPAGRREPLVDLARTLSATAP